MSVTAKALPTDPLWLQAAFKDLGIKELSGKKHNKRVLEMFQLAGHPEVKDDETAWCSAALNAWIVEAGLKGTGSLMARSWTKYGKAVNSTTNVPRGTIVVFPRTGNPVFGHVAIVIHDDGKTLYVIGGNQKNSVSITTYPKSKAIAFRWPNTAKNSGTIKSVTTSGVSTVAAEAASQATESINNNQDTIASVLSTTQEQVSTIATYLTIGKYLLLTVAIATIVYAVYRHYNRHIRN